MPSQAELDAERIRVEKEAKKAMRSDARRNWLNSVRGKRYSHNGLLRCNVRDIRSSMGLSRATVAKGTQLNESVLASIENSNSITLVYALAIAKYFGKPVEEIWQLKD